MCFSATASILSGIGLVAVGGGTMLAARQRRDLAFAVLPLLFGIQQLIEGRLWVALEAGEATAAAYAYTAFSHVLWPVWIPLAVLLQEPRGPRRWVIAALGILGAVVATLFAVAIVEHGVTARIEGDRIFYATSAPWGRLREVAYVVAACGSLLASSRPWIVVFGLTTFVAAVVTYAMFVHAFASVWCFFAAILSVIVAWHFLWRPTTER